MSLNVVNAQTMVMDGRSVLKLSMDDGHEAYICEPKLRLLELGYVYLQSADGYWDRTLPELHVPPNNEFVSGLTLRGFTNDPDVVRRTRKFIAERDRL